MSRAATALLAALVLLGAAGAIAASPAAAAAPRVSASGAILVEASSGRVLYARRPDTPRPIASTTKIMTALVVLERRRLTDVIRVPPYGAGAAESQIGLREGEELTVADLLAALLLPSANDAAHALAVRVGGSRAGFVRLMNRRAAREGLRHTHFSTPVGLDTPGNYSTPRELASLARRLRRHPYARTVMDRARFTLRSGARRRTVLNRNRLVAQVPWVNGVKTGHTLGAGYVLVGSGRRRGVSLVSVVLGTPGEAARDADTLSLLRWGTNSFRWARALRSGGVVAEPRIEDAGEDGPETVDVVAARGARRLVRRSTRLQRVVRVPKTLKGPLRKGAKVGEVVVRARGRVVARADAVTAAAVAAPPAGLLGWLGPASLLLGGVVALALAARVRARRRAARRERQRRRRKARPETA